MKKRNKDKYSGISDEQYASLFGLINPEKKDLNKAAFEKAWETRNYEIDKFWQRSMFFWGFIASIFGGYIIIITGEFNQTAKDMYLDFYLILLGIIFSVAWLLVILGSKRWQENWENHIDYLEDEITGPLYKSLYYKKKKNYYSVSGINKILAWVVIVTWVVLLLQYLFSNCNYIKNMFDSICNNLKEILLLWFPFIAAVICILVMYKKGQTDGGKLNLELKEKLEEEGKDDAFFIKKDKKDSCGSVTRNSTSYEGRENN